MEISQRLLCLLLLASFGAGIALGCVYDLLRMSRMLISLEHPVEGKRTSCTRQEKLRYGCLRLILFAEDVLFALLCGLTLILLSYFINDGEIRWIAPVGMICGYYAYRMTAGKLIRRVLDLLASVMHKGAARLLRFIWKLLYAPLKWLYHILKRRVILPLREAWRKHREAVKHRQESVMIQDSAEVTESILEEK